MEFMGLSIEQIKPYALVLSELQSIAGQLSNALDNINTLITDMQNQGVTSTDKLA
jgi:hypothetical protein